MKHNILEENNTPKKIRTVRPFGSSILVQRLSPAEAMGTNLYVSDDAQAQVPQVRIVAFGPNLKPEDVGLKVGDRLVCVGTSSLVPSIDGKHEYNVLELHNVKAVLEEE